MEIDAKTVMKLRKLTGAGVVDCKQALIETEGSLDKAKDLLRARQGKKLAKLATKSSSEGVVGSYLHHDKRQAALVELRCSTDFVARNEAFQKLANDLAIHVVAASPEPLGLDRADIPADVVARERAIFLEQVSDKPEAMREKIVDGKMNSFFKERVLLDQEFAMDDEHRSIRDVLDQAAAQMGEPVKIARYVKFVMGGGDAEE